MTMHQRLWESDIWDEMLLKIAKEILSVGEPELRSGTIRGDEKREASVKPNLKEPQ
jgi:hypothetical protein